MSIEQAYAYISARFPKVNLDSLQVVKQVEEYRQFWKPKEVRVLLLAESHVSTEDRDYGIRCDEVVLNQIIPNYPVHFVRFVYCLGYGENEILESSIQGNSGTPQFWEIFTSCIAESSENENTLGFHKVLKTRTPLFARLRNKVCILQKMQERGIWLLDASIVGINRIEDSRIRERIIQASWDNYIESVIKQSSPRHLIVIGKGVKNALRLKLWKSGYSGEHITTLPQPNSRLPREEQLENYREYQRKCAQFC